MNVKDRIINNAVQRFVETPVSAPSYYDLNADDGLIQYKDDETKEIFGMDMIFSFIIQEKHMFIIVG